MNNYPHCEKNPFRKVSAVRFVSQRKFHKSTVVSQPTDRGKVDIGENRLAAT